MSNDHALLRLDQPLTRRDTLRGALLGGVALSTGGLLSACGGGSQPASQDAGGAPRSGGTLRIGVAGSSQDSIDAHRPVQEADIARLFQLYEPLAIHDEDYRLQMLLAESIEPAGRPDAWTIRLKPDITFHNGKPLAADDVIFTINRITDPKDPKVGAVLLSDIDRGAMRKLDERTVRLRLKRPNAALPEFLGEYVNGIVPVGYDPKRPVGTGPFRFKSFSPGQRSVFTRNRNYWQKGLPHLDQVVIIDISDDSARVNALLGGQLEAITNLPAAQIRAIKGNSQLRVLTAQTGGWQPFTMRVDQPPFDDARVRQAMRLIVDRPQMIQQALDGQGRVANDLYAPYDACYAANLPQRQQDLDQARSLLRQAGRSDLRVQLTTAPIFHGIVEAAQVFAQQAKGAGVTVDVRKVDSGTFFGDNYLRWPFAQDFWITRNYLPQISQGSLPNSPFNETHWNDRRFQQLVASARATLAEGKRCELLQEAAKIEHDRGGYLVWAFSNQVDAHSSKLTGLVPAKTGIPLNSFGLKSVGFAA
jgi:peptide/nickel transport system substrate-binding protein